MKEYKEWRTSVYERDDYTCQACGNMGGLLHPHHLKPKSLFPEFIFVLENGQTLCISCHKKTDSYANPHMKRESWENIYAQ